MASVRTVEFSVGNSAAWSPFDNPEFRPSASQSALPEWLSPDGTTVLYFDSVSLFNLSSTHISINILIASTSNRADASEDGQDLSSDWEQYSEAIQFEDSSGNTLVIPGPNFSGVSSRDDTEIYSYEVFGSLATAINTYFSTARSGLVLKLTDGAPGLFEVTANPVAFDISSYVRRDAIANPVTFDLLTLQNFQLDAQTKEFHIVLPEPEISNFLLDEINAGDVTFNIAIPQAVVHVAKLFLIDAGNVQFRITTVQPTVQISRDYNLNASSVAFAVRSSQPTIAISRLLSRDVHGVTFDIHVEMAEESSTVSATQLINLTQQFDPGDALVELYILEYKTQKYYLQGSHSEDISYADSSGTVHEYISIPLKIEGIEHSSDGASTRPSLIVANSIFDAIDLQAEEFLGARIIRRQTLKKLLVQNPPVEFPRQKYVIDRVAGSNRVTTEFELASPFDLAGLTLPKRKVIGHLCPWEYQGVDRFGRGGCTWPADNLNPVNSGLRLYDKDDNAISASNVWSSSTSYSNGARVSYQSTDGLNTIYESAIDNNQGNIPSAANSTSWIRVEMCGKRLNSCKLRFQSSGSSSNTALPFGGFPGSRKFR